MENKEAIENLKAATKEFNRALRVKVKEKLGVFAEIDKNAKTYLFDFENTSAKEINTDEVKSEKFVNDAPDEELEYFWIEYTEKTEKNVIRKKFAFYFSDVDTKSHNVHSVPGIFTEFVYKDKEVLDEKKPYIYCDEKAENAVIKNISSVSRQNYQLLAEPCGKGWWEPEKDKIPLKDKRVEGFCPVDETQIETIDDFRAVFKRFAECECAAAKNLADFLYEKSGGKGDLNEARRTERYTPVCWYNFEGTGCSMFLTKPIYFPKFGLFTQYSCIDLGPTENVKFDSEGNIIPNCSVVWDNTKCFKSPFMLYYG